MKILFVGHSTCIPDVGQEMSCLLIDDRHLIDTGWCAALKLREHGLSPLDLESIVLTHFHQDHYIGLPQLLFYIGLRGRREKRSTPLNIAGPSERLQEIVESAEPFLQVDRFPELEVDHRLWPLSGGDGFETETHRFEAFPTRHVSGHQRPEQALGYRVFSKEEGAWFAFTGDTHPHPPLANAVRGAPLLIHDGAHTPSEEAAAIAAAAGVGRLLLTHYSEDRAEQILAAARKVFPQTDLAREGTTITVDASEVADADG